MSEQTINPPVVFGASSVLSCGCLGVPCGDVDHHTIRCLITTACKDHNAERYITVRIMSDNERLALVCGYSPSDNNGKGSAVVEIPKRPNRAGMVVFNRAGDVLLVKGLTSKVECYYFPKGHIDTLMYGKLELPVDAAIREVEEETGVVLDYTTIPFLCYYEYQYKKEEVKVAYFSAQSVTKNGKGDHDSFFCPVAKAKEIIHPGLIPVLEIALGEAIAAVEIEQPREVLKP